MDANDLLGTIEINLRLGGDGPYVQYQLTPAEYAEYLAAPEAVIERLTGVPYRYVCAWIDASGLPSCDATTRKGKPCRGKVPGVVLRTPAEWRDWGGGYCFMHGGHQ